MAQTAESVSDPCEGPIAELSDPRRDRNYQLQPEERGIEDYYGLSGISYNLGLDL